MSLRAVLRVKSPLPNLMLYRDVVQAVKDGSSIEVSLKRTVNSQVIYESDPIDFRDSLLSLKALGKGLVAEYLFYEGSGTTLHDSSGNGNHGTIYGGATWKKLSNGKWVLEFDSMDDYVILPDTQSLYVSDYVVIEALFETKGGNSENNEQIVLRQGNSVDFDIAPDLTCILFRCRTSATWRSIAYGINTLNKWLHVVGIIKPGLTMMMYVNGEKKVEETFSGETLYWYGGAGWTIGKYKWGTNYFNGRIR